MKISLKGGRTIAIAENEQDVRTLLAFKDNGSKFSDAKEVKMTKCSICGKELKAGGIKLHTFLKHPETRA